MATKTIQSVDRALAMLQAVAGADDGQSLSELAEVAGVQLTTAHNLARTLMMRGFLTKSTRRPVRYHSGPALADLVDGRRQSLRRQWTERAVRRLAREVPGATVTMSRFQDGEVTVLLRMSPDQGQVMRRPTGMVLAPYGSMSALVYLAWWSAADRAALEQRYPYAEYGAASWYQMQRLESFLDLTRRQGYASLVTRDRLVRAAIPLKVRDGEMIGTLGVSVPARKDVGQQTKDVVDALRRMAGEAAQLA